MATKSSDNNRSIRVLLVEDNLDHARLMEIMLRKHEPSFEVVLTRSGMECIEQLENNHNFDVVIVDYDLPIMSGLDTLSNIKKIRAEIPVVIVTGKGDENVAVKAMKQGAYDYIIKDKGYLYVLPRVIQQAKEKHDLERKLFQTERKYQNLIENANDAIFIEDPDSGRFVEVNFKAEFLTGYTRDELLEMSADKIHPSEHLERLQQIHEQTIKQGSATYDDMVILTKDNRRIPVDVSASTIDYGSFKVVQKTVRDITEKKRLEQQILESKNRLLSLFDSILDVIYVVNTDFNIVLANRKAAEVTNAPIAQLIGKTCYQYFYGYSEPCPGCPATQTFATKQSTILERTYEDENYLMRSHPFYSLDSQLEQVVMIVQNITDQRRMEKQLIQSEKLATIGLLSSGIAHELRNPLNIIETARYYIADILEDKYPDLHNKLEIIRKNIRRASTIINNLLEFSRHSKEEREEIDVNELIDKTLSLIEKEIRSKNIVLTKEYSQNLPHAWFNLDSLKQVLLNIIINAHQAMPEGGDLKITTFQKDDDWIMVKISDTGCGIPEKNLPHIFSPFFTTKEVGVGTGLGMYISHTIMKKEGGDIQVESKEGVGTTFFVTLPVSKPELIEDAAA